MVPTLLSAQSARDHWLSQYPSFGEASLFYHFESALSFPLVLILDLCFHYTSGSEAIRDPDRPHNTPLVINHRSRFLLCLLAAVGDPRHLLYGSKI